MLSDGFFYVILGYAAFRLTTIPEGRGPFLFSRRTLGIYFFFLGIWVILTDFTTKAEHLTDKVTGVYVIAILWLLFLVPSLYYDIKNYRSSLTSLEDMDAKKKCSALIRLWDLWLLILGILFYVFGCNPPFSLC